jgi:hypothetical protein
MDREEATMERRGLLSPLLAGAALSARTEESKKPLKIMFKSAWGSDDPTKAAFAFFHGNALAEAGHTVQIFLLGEAVSLMRASVAHAVVPVGWPPLEGSPRQGGHQQNPNLRLRCVLAGPQCY